MIKDFLKKYRYSILLPLLVVIALTILLVLFAGGPQKGAFRYQVF